MVSARAAKAVTEIDTVLICRAVGNLPARRQIHNP